MTILFVYGTLKRGYGNNVLLKGQKFLGEACTKPKYRLWDFYIPGLTEDAKNGKAIRGELWDVDDACLKQVDRLEGHPHHYKRQELEMDLTLPGRLWVNGEPVYGYIYQCPLPLGAKDCGSEWTGRRRACESTDDSFEECPDLYPNGEGDDHAKNSHSQ